MTTPLRRARSWHRILLAAAGAVLCSQSFSAGLSAQAAARMGDHEALASETFVRAPAVIERIITAPRTDVSFNQPSPDRGWFLRTTGKERGDIAQYGKPHIYLAGLLVETRANRSRALTTSTRLGLELVDPRTGATKTLETPRGASLSSPVWSPTGTQVAYIANLADASHVFVADVGSGKSVQVTRTPLLATLVTTLEWTVDGRSLVAVTVPDGRGPEPVHGNDGIEDGPQVRLSESRILPQRIHFSLLQDPHEKALLEYHATGQLVLIDVRSKSVERIGAPAMIKAVDASPDGRHFLVTRMTEPFSYLAPISAFGSVQELWDASGKVVTELAVQPLREGEQTGDGDTGGGGGSAASEPGRRNVQWHPTGSGLVYLESVFPAGSTQPTGVRLVGWAPPFGAGDLEVLYEGSAKLTSVAYGADGRTMFVADSGTVIAVTVGNPAQRHRLGRGVTIQRLGGGNGGGGGGSASDTVDGDGVLQSRFAANGSPVVIVGSDGKSVLLAGARAPRADWMNQAPRPWLDRLDFESGRKERIFESPTDAYDQFVVALDDDASAFIYTHESPTLIRDAHLRDRTTSTSRQVTHARDVAPEVSGAQRRRFQVTRPRDGVKFWVDVTLPADWTPGTRLPGVIWFYPREYTSQMDYDRSRYGTNINAFPDTPPARPASSVKLWVTQGYALIEPDIPILGFAGRMNDNYTRDLVENLDAVVDAVVDAGFVDRNRMAAGGHSYGAFSTVNALTLTNYFKAGIAGDGMYNRSLTPFGFQSERRTFYNAQDTYLDMSPFFRADKISGALLLYHSLEDQNVGTAPISSIRMFHALQGLGKPAALYLYPYEDHSVATYQTDLDQWARWTAWFDLYVKGLPTPKMTTSSSQRSR